MAWIDSLFRRMVEVGASDLHLSSMVKPSLRLHGDMLPIEECPELKPDQMRQVLFEITPKRNQEQFEADHDTDFAYEIDGLARFRINLFCDRKGPGAVCRVIPAEILTAEQLGLPQAVIDMCHLSKGLVVVTGPTGSGKSTTLAAMVDYINKKRKDHIITIEDPIEFVHDNHECLINQREVGRHTGGFKRALRAALREDPDIVLVGEMRDLETIEIAIETAETGHLVFGTLHTTTAASTVDRIIDQFSADRQAQIRTMLATSLKGVVAQTLCKKKPSGRIAALEILVVNNAVSSQIREGKTHMIGNAMQMGAKEGMRMLNDSLAELVASKTVEPMEAYLKAVDKDAFKSRCAALGVQFNFAAQPPTSPAAKATAPAAREPRPPLPQGSPEGARPSGDPFQSYKSTRNA
jgi:twitching motility protein PilT